MQEGKGIDNWFSDREGVVLIRLLKPTGIREQRFHQNQSGQTNVHPDGTNSEKDMQRGE